MPGRRHERFDATLALRLEHSKGIVRNVSASGVYFVTDVALATGATVKFSICFEDYPGGPIAAQCSARIVRVERQGAFRGVAAAICRFDFRRLPQCRPTRGNGMT